MYEIDVGNWDPTFALFYSNVFQTQLSYSGSKVFLTKTLYQIEKTLTLFLQICIVILSPLPLQSQDGGQKKKIHLTFLDFKNFLKIASRSKFLDDRPAPLGTRHNFMSI